MKKKDLTKLAMLGIGAGLLMGGCQDQSKQKSDSKDESNNAPHEEMAQDIQTFAASLSPEAKKQFMELDAKHKMMALEMTHQSCNGKNACKGMGGCKSDANSCCR